MVSGGWNHAVAEKDYIVKKMKFITYATHSERYYPALISSYERFSADYVVLGFGEEWKDYFQKMMSILNYLRESCDPNQIVCIMDGFDSILTGSPNHMEQKFKDTGAELIFSSTEFSKLLYPLIWKNTSFVNAGLYIGYARSIIFLIETIMDTYDGGYFNDQRLFGKWMAKNKNPHYQVDQENIFFLNVSKFTPYQYKHPFAISGPGYANLEPYIDHLGITFQSTNYQNGHHTAWNRICQGEFSEEFQCIIPIIITILLLITIIVIPLLAIYYGNE